MFSSSFAPVGAASALPLTLSDPQPFAPWETNMNTTFDATSGVTQVLVVQIWMGLASAVLLEKPLISFE